MDRPLDDLYLEWLYSQVASTRFKTPTRTYWRLLRQLYTTEFVWFVPNDDNRAADGRDLRLVFRDELKIEVDPDWMDVGCSFLEMLIALAKRISLDLEDGRSLKKWFWTLLENIDLKVSDAERIGENQVTDILNRVIFRTYKRTGEGGLFPQKHPARDQRKVELWYQLMGYLDELDD